MSVKIRVRWDFSFESFCFVFDEFELDFFFQTDLIFFIGVMVFILFCDIFKKNS